MSVLKVGITGQSGFIGYHLVQRLRLYPDDIEIIPFNRAFFQDSEMMEQFVDQCDVIVHLAAMNRGPDNEIYATNVRLVERLITALESRKHTPHVIFSSSTQEARDSVYGHSKRQGTQLLQAWAERNNAHCTSLIIPNVFGPFGKPFYNSVVGTFCHQLTHGQEPKIEVDASLSLISVMDLVKEIVEAIRGAHNEPIVYIAATSEMKVSEILHRLVAFKDSYIDRNIVPKLEGHIDVDLFNTFRSYIEPDHFPIYPAVHADDRGHLAEVIKELSGGQVFFSMTKPGITRGNHYHMRKVERFCVIQGEAMIRLRKIGANEIIEYRVTGSRPSFIDIPIYYTHNITNVGTTDLLTLFWTNELFDARDSDTFPEPV